MPQAPTNISNKVLYFKTSYDKLPPHQYAVGSAKLWYSGDDFSDGSTVKLEIFVTSELGPSMEALERLENPCLTMSIPHHQKQVQPPFELFYFGAVHNYTELYLVMKFTVSSSDNHLRFFGFREVTIHLNNEFVNTINPSTLSQDCTANCEICFGTKYSQCLSCSPGSHWNGSECINCHGHCEKCTGPTEHECLACTFGYFSYGNGTCLETCNWPFHEVEAESEKLCLSTCKSDEYVFKYNQTCLASCPMPFASLTDSNGIFTCEVPCENPSDFVYLNGSCLSGCPAPLAIEAQTEFKFCKSPCKSASDYLFANGSCLAKCPSLLKVRYESVAKYCENPCDSKDLYLYNNGSCLLTCQFPLVEVSESGVRHCRNPCKLVSDYLYLNQSCFKECPAPLQIKSEPIANFCVNPCHLENQYLYKNGSCLSNCPAPLVAVFDPLVRYCRNPCKSMDDYLYANRSCLKQCPFPLKIRSEPIAHYCENPCHSMSRYLHHNGSCLSTCPFPLKTREEFGVKYCLAPCRMNGEYILKDGSCSAECPSPLVQRTELGVGTFCLNPCESDGHFVAKNGSCLLNCPTFFAVKIEYGVKYCLNPCSPGQYYFPQNISCLETCPNPYKIASEEGINLCKNPCSEEANPFLYNDGSCHETCPGLLRIEHGNYCKSPCQEENGYVNEYGDCQESCVYPDIVVKEGPYQFCVIDEINQRSRVRKIIKMSNSLSETGGILSCLVNAGDPTSILMMPLLKIFEQITMIEARLPVSVEAVLNGKKNLEKSQILVRLRENIDYRIRILAIICGVYFLLVCIRIFIRSNRRSEVSQLLHSIWSIFVLMVISMNGDTVLYLILSNRLRQNELAEFPRTLIYLVVILFTISVVYKIIRIRRRQPNTNQGQQNISDYPERWRFFFGIYKSDGLFMLISLMRVTLLSLVIGCLSEYPHIQAILILAISFAMLLYLILGLPIAKRISFLQHMVIEAALLLYNGVFAILVACDLEGESAKQVFGQSMIILYLITSLITALIIWMKLMYNVYDLLFKARGGLQTGHIQLREFSQSSEEEEGEVDESFEQEPEQQSVANEIVGFEEINQQGKERFWSFN